jgi:hypothetical protein
VQRFDHRLQGARFSKISKTHFEVSKNPKKIDVENNVLYKREKISTKNAPYFGLHKNNNLAFKVVNSIKFQSSKSCQILSFLSSPEYKVFRVDILYVGTVHYLHPGFFYQIFLTLKCFFQILNKNQAPCSLRSRANF